MWHQVQHKARWEDLFTVLLSTQSLVHHDLNKSLNPSLWDLQNNVWTIGLAYIMQSYVNDDGSRATNIHKLWFEIQHRTLNATRKHNSAIVYTSCDSSNTL